MGKIGAVILNYMTWEETGNCVKTIQKSRGIDEVQIYVIDNGSPNVQDSKCLPSDGNVHLIFNEKNVGYAAGNNVGIERALNDGCDYLLIANNDVLFEKNSISKMQQYLALHQEYGIAAPCVLDKNREVQRCHFMKKAGYGDIWLTQTILRYGYHKRTDIVYGTLKDYKSGHDIFAASGCCFMMSAECAKNVTPLDENTFLYEEENILGVRMEQQRYKTRYIPDSRVIHNHDQTTRLVKPFALICWACSEIYYLKKYLSVSQWKIKLLYRYRTLIFLIHGLKDSDYRRQWGNYRTRTRDFLISEKFSGGEH